MLNLIGNGRARTCNGTSRRDFLQVGALGAAGLSLSDWVQAKEAGALDPAKDNKSCILIFNLGDGKGLFFKKSWIFSGRLAMVFKDILDRRFMGRFQVSGEREEDGVN